MPDIAKRLNKKGQLPAGEKVVAGCFCSPLGDFGSTVAFGATGAIVSEAKAKKKASEATTGEKATLAAQMPAGRALIGVTGQRVVVFGFGTALGTTKDLEAAFEFAQIRQFHADHGVASSKMCLTFIDGSFRWFESVRGGKPKNFSAALQQALAVHT